MGRHTRQAEPADEMGNGTRDATTGIGARPDAQASDGSPTSANALPSWLLEPEGYVPSRDRDGFIARSTLSIASALSRLRLDDGQRTVLSPSAPTKLLVGLALILLTSLSRNFAFVLVMLTGTLLRVALLPARAMRRVVTVAFATASLTTLLMLPAVFIGQPQSAVLMGTKVLVSVSITLTVALSTPVHELTGGLRSLHVSSLAIMVVDLALKNIVSLGTVALEVLRALRLRSVGTNRSKGDSMGGVGGIVFLKAHKAAEDTSDAMRCRGFDGEYRTGGSLRLGAKDVAWACALALVVALFVYLERQV